MEKQTRTVGIGTAVAIAAALWLGAGPVWAGTEGRVNGQVVDQAGQPVADVEVVISAVGLDIKRAGATNKKGKFMITLLNASRDWIIRLEKEGYQIIEEPIDPVVGGTLKPSYTLVVGQTIEPEKLAELQRKDKGAKLYNQGVKKFAEGEIDAAAAFFRDSLAEDANLGLAHLALARIHLAKDDFVGALPYAEKTHELVPEEEMSQVILFDALWGVEQNARALELLDEMVVSGKVPDKVAVRAYNAGVRRVKSQEWDIARTRFEQVLALDASLAPAHLTLSQIIHNQGDYAGAAQHAEAYLAAKPGDARGLSMLYQTQLAAGNEEAAQAAFDQMAAADPQMVAQTFFEEGVNHFNAGRTTAAHDAFEKVLRAQPDHPRAHYQLGLTSASNGEIDKAKEYLARFLELAPEDPEAAFAREMLAGL